MKVSILASGSTGNVTYIETNQRKILVDAGLSGKKIASLMASIDRSLSEVDTLLITHEHVDHVKGIGVLARKYGLSLYANESTWRAIGHSLGDIPSDQKFIFDMGKTLTFGDVDVTSFGVSHDAAAPQFYSFQQAEKRFVMLTDTGYVSDQLRYELANADMYLMESNHDLELLRNGKYPWSLKQRILGDQGHLSNEDSALAMKEMIGSRTKRIYLGHLSKENNMKPLARETVEVMLNKWDLGLNSQFYIFDTDPETATPLVDV